jgi:hypothetical protein
MLNLPESAFNEIPASLLADMKTNPNILMDNSKIGSLEAQINPLITNKSNLIDTILSVMQESLAESIADIFVIALVITVIAAIVTFWLKEIPLQKRAGKEVELRSK